MLLFLLRTFRQVYSRIMVLCLVVNVAAPAFASLPPPPPPPLPTPSITGVSGTCQAMTANWSDSGSDAQYEMQLNGTQAMLQVVSGTSFTFSNLSAGPYSLAVEALSISGASGPSAFSASFPFNVVCAPVCQAPVVTVTSVSPSPICRQEHGSTSVTFAGSITSACALSSVQYTLTDSHGPGSQGPVTVNSDGSFNVILKLAAHRSERVYTLTVSATNSVGTITSGPVSVSVERCRHHHGDKNDDRDRDHDD